MPQGREFVVDLYIAEERRKTSAAKFDIRHFEKRSNFYEPLCGLAKYNESKAKKCRIILKNT